MAHGNIEVVEVNAWAQVISALPEEEMAGIASDFMIAQASGLQNPHAKIKFNIAPQAASSALIEFGRQADVSILVESTARDIQLPGLQGEYALKEGLELILKDTGLRYRINHESIFVSQDIKSARASGSDKEGGAARASFLAAVSAVILSVFGPATATGQTGQDAANQDPTSSHSTVGLDEVVVTAQRRETLLQDLPISVRALTEEELQRSGAVRMEDYVGLVPSLFIVEQSTANSMVVVRGVTSGNVNFDRPEFRPMVGLYLDEAPIAAQHFKSDLALLDLERIEVMRGPQPILYGADSLSGTIRMITKKPDLAEFGGRLGAGGSYTEHGGGNFDVNGVLNVPIIKDELALRAVGFYRDEDGYIDNPVRGKDNVNTTRDVGGRLALRYEPTAYFRLDVSVGYQDTHEGMTVGFYEDAGDLNALWAAPNPFDSDLTVASLVAEVDFDAATLTSATSYFGNDSVIKTELSRFSRFVTGDPIFGPPTPDDFIFPITSFTGREEFTQELRFVSNQDSSVTWIAGLLFQQQNWDFGEDLLFPGIDDFAGIDSTDFLVEPDNIFKSRLELETTQLSSYGEVSVTLFDRLTLKGGLRWFYAVQDSTTFYGGILSAPVGTASADQSEDGINPTVNVSYQIDDDRMIYFQAARGFRLGGTNQPIPGDLCRPFLEDAGFTRVDTFDSDHLWSYEVGLKSSWLNNRLRANAAGYLIDWDSPPFFTQICPGFGSLNNLGKVDVSGFELDIEAALAKGLVSSLGVSYTDSGLGEDVPFINGVEGEKSPYIPEFTLNFSLDYEFPIALFGAGVMAFVHGDVRWVDDRITGFPGDPTIGRIGLYRIPSYSEGNLRAGLYSDGAWRVEVFIRNLGDARPELFKSTWLPFLAEHRSAEVGGLSAEIRTLRPRTFGVQVSRDF